MSGLKSTYLTPLTEVSTTDKEGVGTLRCEKNKWYKWVNLKNTTATVAAAAGTLVAYFAATGYLNNRVVVDLTDADSAVFAAGATLATITGTAGTDYYCWIQIKGHITLDTSVGSGAAGSPFYLTATDKTAAIMSAATQSKAGVSMNATTGVCLDCPF